MYKKQSLQDARMHDLSYTNQPRPQPGRGTEHRRIQLNPPPPVDLPLPPPDHLISMFTRRLNTVIQQDNVELLKSTIKSLQKLMETNLDFYVYDCSAFDAAMKTASASVMKKCSQIEPSVTQSRKIDAMMALGLLQGRVHSDQPRLRHLLRLLERRRGLQHEDRG